VNRALDAIPPAGAAAVMGTGIVSIGLGLDHQPTLSRLLFALAIALWLGVLAALVRRALRQRERLRREARMPGVLTAVAGTTVVGARIALAGQAWAGDALLVLGLCLWFALLSSVLRHWRTPTVGVSFMPAVATESLAVLAALLAIEAHVSWLALCAVAPLLAGIVAYVFAAVRVDLRQLVAGRGDQWIFGGALAIAALACAQVSVALQRTGTLPTGRRALDDAALALWSAAALWLPALLAGELISPRLRYDSRRWSTVFPLGMYAAATIAAGNVNGIGGLADAGRICVWPAFALWGITFAGLLAHGGGLLLAAARDEIPAAMESEQT
jgi:tellurite resistance protein TehA-like permease